MASDYQAPRAALRSSHEHLAGLLSAMPDSAASDASYCADWTIAGVLSHLGSGAEIFDTMFQAALDGRELPGRESFQPFWDKWNAKSPAEVKNSVLAADAAYLEALEGVDSTTFDNFEMQMFGRQMDAAGLVSMRLGEHTLHTWDVEVMGNSSAALQQPGVNELIDRTPANAARFGSGPRPSFKGVLEVHTTAPERRFGLDLSGEQVSLAAEAPSGEGNITMPAESLIRLLYGRLDAEHTPVSVSGPVSLDELRALFPGF